MLYRYVQSEEKGIWTPIAVNKHFSEELEKFGATRMSVLAVNGVINDNTAPGDVQYIGPLYFDIDFAGNLNLAISSTQELVYKLRELDVPDEGIQVYASGSKGFHVFVPESLFLPTQRPVKSLPYIYMEMARDLYVMGVDFSAYAGGRGKLFRPENGLRPDGKYRVRITLEELDNMTPELYKQLVSAPRQVSLKGPNGHRSPHLQALYEQARKRAHAKQTLRGTALPLEALEPYAEEPPACVDLLVKGELIKDTNFNRAGMQLAAFVARSGAPDYKADSLATLMAEHTESHTYNSVVKRKVHLHGLISYARAKPTLAFTCAAMRSVVGGKACSECPLNNKKLEDSTEVDAEGAVLGVLAQQEGYYLKREKGETRISTFTLHPTEVYLDQPQGEGSSRRVTTRMEVYSKGDKVGTVMFDESGWRSKSEFLKQVEGIPDIAFLATDVDVQRIKYAVYRHTEEDDVEEVINVYSAGIHASMIGKKKIYTYVEPGLSVNTVNVQGTHRLQGTMMAPPQIRLSAKPEPRSPLMSEALTNLMQVNAPAVVAQILGWHSAAHLKAHISSAYKQFPILNLWGEASSGKTFTSALFSYLNGVDYRNGGSPLSCSTATTYPLVEACSSTTTVPRLLEEFNQSQMRPWMYTLVTDLLKHAWDGMAVPRGTLLKSQVDGRGRTGARVESLYMTAPIVLCSEQAPQKPALRQRSVQVQLTRQGRNGREREYARALELKDQLLSTARAMTFMALRTKDEWIKERYDANMGLLDSMLFDRFKFSFATLLVGLDFFEAVTESLELGLQEQVQDLRQALLGGLVDRSKEISTDQVWSEVDLFLSSLAELAQLSSQNSSTTPLTSGRNFIIDEANRTLLLDLTVAFPLYKRHLRSLGEVPVFSSLRSLEPLLRSESYYVGSRMMPEVTGVRQLWVLDLDEMMKKGHDISMWVGAM